MTATLGRVRAMFPHMPREVFDLWIAPAVPGRNWPFVTGFEPVLATAWERFFLNEPISYWASLRWRTKQADFDDAPFHPKAFERAEAILSEAAGIPAFTIPIENTVERFHSCFRYIMEHHSIPGPIVVEEYADGDWYVLDGHHRLAAIEHYLSTDQAKAIEIPIWIGRNESLRADT